MNDFDRRLETELARMLDRVVRSPAPPRRGRPGRRVLSLSVVPARVPPVAADPTLISSPALFY
jgi:hypothetical protein